MARRATSSTDCCELRAVIETLRCERAAQDPLLAWIIEQEREDIRRRD